ncbi:hypothetical protein KPL78_05240 [Roseomonas sp. HJA6]|uniref:Uncharacterized protein n=1 Tax=Roseomonas alba TaxID=2846776 RepID=A0ABS7A4K5_9PROT|nr:hypothetical protein [Neoroseomonas alba]MBW6397242.1 hypothetical protein [Neoroseomonas alba]
MRTLPSRRGGCKAAAIALSLLWAGFSAAPAHAQDSFARMADDVSGRPVFSVLGTGLGLPYAMMALEMGCPAHGVWTMDLTGIQAAPGVRLDVGFGDPRGGFIAVPAVPVDESEDRLRFTVGRTAFARALAQARAEYPAPEGGELQVLVGGVAGLAIGRDAMAREMTVFLEDCEPARRTTTARR